MRISKKSLHVEVLRQHEHGRAAKDGGDREVLVDWLNNTLDQAALERVKALMDALSLAPTGFDVLLKNLASIADGATLPDPCKLTMEKLFLIELILSGYSFKPAIFPVPYASDGKWMLGWECVRPTADFNQGGEPESPESSELLPLDRSSVPRDFGLDKLTGKTIYEVFADALKKTMDRPATEGDAITALLYIAADGLVDTVKQCYREDCKKWHFRPWKCCSTKCSQAFREDTEKRKEKRRADSRKRNQDIRGGNEIKRKGE